MAPDSIRQKCHLPEPNPTEGRPILSGMWLTEPAKIERILRWKEKVQKPQSQREKKQNYNNTPPTSEPLLPKGLYLYNVSSQSYIIDTLSHIIDTLSHIIDTLSHIIDTLSHTIDTLSHIIDTLSHIIDTLSHIIDTLSHTIDTLIHTLTPISPVLTLTATSRFFWTTEAKETEDTTLSSTTSSRCSHEKGVESFTNHVDVYCYSLNF